MKTSLATLRVFIALLPLALTLTSCNFGLFKFGESGKSLLGRFIRKLPSAVVVETTAGDQLANACKQYTVALRNQDLLEIDLSEQDKFVPVSIKSFINEQARAAIYRSAAECNAPTNAFSLLTVNIPPGEDKATFFVRNQLAGNLRLGITSPSLQGHDFQGPIYGNAPSQIAVFGKQNPTAGQCVAQEIQLNDASGNRATKTQSIDLTLTRLNGVGRLYSRPPCLDADALPTTSGITIPGSATTYTVYYKSDDEGSTQVRYQGNGLAQETIVYSVGAGLPVKLALTLEPPAASGFSADDLKSGTCHRFRVEARDFLDNPTNQTDGLTVSFVAPSAAAGRLYKTQADCNENAAGNPGSSGDPVVFIAGSQTSKDFYVRGIAIDGSQIYRLVTTNQSGQELSVNMTKSFRGGDPHQFSVTEGVTLARAGACIDSSFLITLKDRWGNNTVAPSGMGVRVSGEAGSDRFFTGTSCTGSGANVLNFNIASMGGSARFTFKTEQATLQQPSTARRRITVQETGTTLNDVGNAISPESNNGTLLDVEPAVADRIRLRIGGSPASGTTVIKAGEGQAVSVDSTDAFGNYSNVSSATSVTLNETDTTGDSILYRTDCATATSSVSIPANANTVNFCVKKTTIANAPAPDGFNVSATAAFGSTQPAAFSAIPNAARSIEFTNGSNVTASAGQCLVKTIQAKDAFSNVTTDHGSRLISLSPNNNSVKFFSNTSACSGSIVTSINFSAGSATQSLRFEPRVVPGGGPGLGTVTITASISNPSSSDSFQLMFGPGPIDAVSIANAPGPTTLSLEGSCGSFSVSPSDAFGNAMAWGTTTLDIINPNTGVELFSGTCETVGSTTSLAVLASDSSTTFNLRGKKVGNQTFALRHPASSVSSANKALTIKREDFAFMSNGIKVDSLGGTDRANAVVATSGSNFATAGISSNQFTVTRYNQSGSTFDAVPTQIDLSAGVDEAMAIARLDAARLVAVGYGTVSGKKDLAIAVVRIDNGQVEASITHDYEGSGSFHDVAQAVAIHNGSIVVGGYVDSATGRQIAVSRFQFSAGVLTHIEDLAVSVAGEIRGLALYNGGAKFAAVGADANLMATYLIDSDLAAVAGPVRVNIAGAGAANGVAVDGANNVYVAGVSGNKPALVKYNAAGTQLATMGLSSVGSLSGVVVLGTHVIAAGQFTDADKDFAIYRFNASNLSEDATFGGGSGMVRTTGVGTGHDEANGLAIVNDRFVAAGAANTLADHAVVRYRTE